MKKSLIILVVFGLGVALGRMFDGGPPPAEAGGGNPLPPCQDINGDGQSNVSDAIYFLQWRFLGGPEPTCPITNGQRSDLPSTGQTVCYDQSGKEMPCDDAACPGQDAVHRAGCPSEGRFDENGDGTVTDNCTGLMWQKDTADIDGDGEWEEGDRLPWCDALSYCDALNFAGHDDWRLPNVRELQSIVDYGRVAPSIDPIFGALSDAHWSSTTSVYQTDYAWYVYFYDGYVYAYDAKPSGLFIRAVRSGR